MLKRRHERPNSLLRSSDSVLSCLQRKILSSKIFSEPPQSPQTRHATSTHVAGGRESENLTNLHSPPCWILIFQCPIHKFSKPKGIPFHTKQMPSFRMSSLLKGSIVRVSPFRYRSSLGSSTEREITASASFFRKASASG